MQLHRQAELLRALEQATGFLAAEADAFAERIDRIDQAFGGERGQHLVADQRHVVGAAIGVLRRQRMQAEKTGAHADAELAAESARHAQHAPLAVEIQPVTGLDLQRGHAVGKQRPCTRQRLRQQLFLAGGAGGVDGGNDAAAGARDLLVAGAVETQVELLRAIAAEHQMRVAVDQARRDQRTVERFDHPASASGAAGSASMPPIQAMRP